ncbi:hypothetical protein EXIGLDRAFT_728850 [Exidia glandulosa HHB12029]|uniref:F-box domain-containing protein n=1 Tax=Exidia glandulosa HHB12029 TaxID=1314781 RepID=A0A165CUC3_EXIGL|nr:hypothetical protein EXIGLDRAFT_728850 [Exidia glandulosa HHB12029]
MLPPELLLQIFSYLEWPYDLPTAALTSRVFADCAALTLARTLPIPFVPDAQDRLVPWLSRLLEPSSHHLRTSVLRVVLDDVAKPLEPTIPSREQLEHDTVPCNRYIDEELPNRGAPAPHVIHYMLQALLPQLNNVHAVFLRRHVSWFLLDALPPVVKPQKGNGLRWSSLGKVVPRKLTLNRRRFSDSTNEHEAEPDHSDEAAEDGVTAAHRENQIPPNVWSLLMDRKPHLREMFICCLSSAKLPDASLARNLTTVNLHDLDCRVTFASGGDRTPWTPLLLACEATLENLCLVRVLGFATLIAYTPPPPADPSLPPPPPPKRTAFPALRNLEVYKMALRGIDSEALSDFIERHSPSLRVLALGIRCDLGSATNPATHLVSRTWLDNPDLLPKLEVLRLENSDFLSSWTEPPLAAGTEPPTAAAVTERKRRIAKHLANFVLARPSITDVTFPDLTEPEAAAVRRAVGGRGRVLLGVERLVSFETHVPASPPAHRRFLWSAWVFYELLFKGLILERSGFRPPLPGAASPSQVPRTMNWSEALANSNSRVSVRTARRFR